MSLSSSKVTLDRLLRLDQFMVGESYFRGSVNSYLYFSSSEFHVICFICVKALEKSMKIVSKEFCASKVL